MKLSNMGIVFILIMVPILLVFSLYIQTQNKTIERQMDCDTKIMSATSEAIASLEMNTFGTITKSNAATMRRNIQAAVNSFVNSYAANFGVTGYDKSDVLSYVPALLFTMYDGIYIYAPTTDQQDIDNASEANHGNYVLKPYIYYSARYQEEDKYDVVINYSLDNYINITGTINEEYISKSGYLIDTDTLITEKQGDKMIVTEVEATDNSGNKSRIRLESESLYENITFFEEDYNLDGSIDADAEKVIQGKEEPIAHTYNLPYVYGKEDKQKYYYYQNGDTTRVFKYNALGIIVEEKNDEIKEEVKKQINEGDTSAKRFYQEAYEFSKYVKDEIIGKGIKITPSTMVKPDGMSVSTLTDPNDPYYVFAGDSETNILDANIDKDYFTQHKLNIMQAIIKDNLNVAISSYSNGAVSDFYMPEISETEWEKILTNISMVSFVQGMPIGLKTYNNYAVVTSTNNELYVGEDSIYYVEDAENEYKADESGEVVHKDHHTARCQKLLEKGTDIRGYAITEFDKHTVNYMTEYQNLQKEFITTDHYLYYYKHHSLDCYDCIVNKVTEVEENDDVVSAKIHAMARIKHNQIKTTATIKNR